jgi:glyoxylase-like metal-dependent hydrolase (beta-lactamase superfamily II)
MGETTKRIRSAAGQAAPIAVDGPKLFALADGFLDMDLSRFPDVVRGIGDDLATADGQDLNDMSLSVNAFLIQTGDRLCLVDAGDGTRRGDTLGHVRAAIKAAGYDPEDVTDLLMTHLHGDHAAGLVEGSTALFPQADLHVSAEEVRFWNAPEEHDAIQATQVPFALAALAAYRERVKLLQPGGEVLPGIATQALPGHTPGQIGFRIGTEQPVLISADVLHLPALQVKHPEWGFLFDADKARALQTRKEILATVPKAGLRLAGAHMPFPGVIRVVEQEQGLTFERAEG